MIMRSEGDDPRTFYESRPESVEVLPVMTARETVPIVSGDLHIVHLGAGARHRWSRVTKR